MLGPDGQPAADLGEDLGGIPPTPGASCSQPALAVRAGLGQISASLSDFFNKT